MSDISHIHNYSGNNNDLDGILFSKSPNSHSNYPNSFIASPPTQFFSNYQPAVSDYTKKYNSLPPQQRSGNKTQEELEHLIGAIPFPDVSMTSSFNSSISNNTPQKGFLRSTDHSPKHGNQLHFQDDRSKPPMGRPSLKSSIQKTYRLNDKSNKENVNANKGLFFDPNAQSNMSEGPNASMKGSLTPDKMNKFMDWSKTHVTPGDGRTIFPQIIAPSIEISGDNSHGKLQEIREDLSNENTTFDGVNELRGDISNRNGANAAWKGGEDSKLRILNQQLTDQLKQVDNEFNLQKKLFKNLEQENNYLSQKISEQQEKIEYLQAKYESNMPLEGLRGKNLDQAKIQIKQMQTFLEKKEDKISELSAQLQRQKRIEESLKGSIDKEIKNIQHEASRHRIVSESQKKRVAEVEQENQDLKQNLKDFERKFKNAIDNANSQLQARGNDLDYMNDEISQRDNHIAQLSQNIAELNQRLMGSQEETKDREQQYAQLKKQYEILFNERNLAQAKNDNGFSNMENEREEQLIQEIDRQKERFTVQLNQLKGKNAELMNELQNEKTKAARLTNQQMQMPSSANSTTNDLQGLLGLELSQTTTHNTSRYRKESNNNVSVNGHEAKCVNQSTQCNSALDAVEKTMITLSMYDSGLTLEAGLKKLEEEHLRLRERYGKMEREFNGLRNEHERVILHEQSLRHEYEQMSISMHQLQQEREDTARFKSNEGKRTESPRRQDKEFIAKYQDQIQILSDKLLQSQEENTALTETKRGLENKVRGLEVEAKNLGYEVQRIREEHDNMKIQKEKVISELRTRGEEVNQTLKRRVEDLEQRNVHLANELRERDNVIEEQRDRLDDSQSHQELEQNIEKINKEIYNNLEKKVTGLQEELGRMNIELIGKDHTIAALTNEITDKEYNLENAKRGKSDLDKIYEENYERLREHIKSLESDNMNYLKETQDLREKLKGQTSQLDDLQKNGNSTKGEAERLKNKLKDEHERVEYLEKLKAELERSNKDYCNQIGEFEEQIKAIQAKESKLNEEVNDLKTQILEMELSNKDLQKEKSVSFKQCRSVETQKETLQAQIEEYKSEVILKNVEIKHLIEKMREHEAKVETLQSELATKGKEGDKLKKETAQAEKNCEALKKEKNALKEKLDSVEEKNTKENSTLKEKDASIKQLEGKIDHLNQLLKEKDRKNLDLYNQNKSLQEKVKVVQDGHTALKAELEKKNRIITQKANELKTVTATTEKLEDKNRELQNTIEDLNNSVFKLENDISILQCNIDNQSQSINLTEKSPKDNKSARTSVQEEERAKEQLQINQDLDGKREELEETRREFQTFLEEFKHRENEFEHIKEKLLERIVVLNEKISSQDKRSSGLMEENNFLNNQISLYQKNNSILQEKIHTIEGTIRNYNNYDYEDYPTEQRILIENYSTQKGKNTNRNVFTQRTERIFEPNYSEPDELKMPPGYNDGENILRSINKKERTNFNHSNAMRKSKEVEFDGRSQNHHALCPEMLSTEETVGLVLDVLRRAGHSSDLASALRENVDFKHLSGTLKKGMMNDYEEKYENSAQSHTRRTKRTRPGEEFYFEN